MPPPPIAFPLRRRLRRSRYSSGKTRDTHGISILEERLANRLYRLVKLQARVAALYPDDEVSAEMVVDMLEAYIERRYCRSYVLPRPVRRHIVIANLPEFTGEDYRFRSRSDLTRLFVSLRWPQRIGPMDNGQFCDGQISFLFFIRRISSTCRVSDLIREFGRDKSLWSRVFKWSVRHIEAQFEAILDDYHPEHVARFAEYAESIHAEVYRHLIKQGRNEGGQGGGGSTKTQKEEVFYKNTGLKTKTQKTEKQKMRLFGLLCPAGRDK